MYTDELINVFEAFSTSFVPCQISQLLSVKILYLATASQPSFNFIFVFGTSLLHFSSAVLPIPVATMLFPRSKSFSVSVSDFVFGLISWLLLTSPETLPSRIPYSQSTFTNAQPVHRPPEFSFSLANKIA
ncbi:df6110a3-188f-451b-ab94-556ed9bb489e [Sclerotinia trifoliorum]|uniref:Df6110a3-188f-451b-ab94-556ed9bb489e n=1 Tax=Sclerotinia trifoliorum TaxID=28548 RepID=A0A8H2VWK5_9HELO|nr:df6110a3-188f-451b-ab94-556ed9bb489e [Sclerotinia trifoliorum]